VLLSLGLGSSSGSRGLSGGGLGAGLSLGLLILGIVRVRVNDLLGWGLSSSLDGGGLLSNWSIAVRVLIARISLLGGGLLLDRGGLLQVSRGFPLVADGGLSFGLGVL